MSTYVIPHPMEISDLDNGHEAPFVTFVKPNNVKIIIVWKFR